MLCASCCAQVGLVCAQPTPRWPLPCNHLVITSDLVFGSMQTGSETALSNWSGAYREQFFAPAARLVPSPLRVNSVLTVFTITSINMATAFARSKTAAAAGRATQGRVAAVPKVRRARPVDPMSVQQQCFRRSMWQRAMAWGFSQLLCLASSREPGLCCAGGLRWPHRRAQGDGHVCQQRLPGRRCGSPHRARSSRHPVAPQRRGDPGQGATRGAPPRTQHVLFSDLWCIVLSMGVGGARHWLLPGRRSFPAWRIDLS